MDHNGAPPAEPLALALRFGLSLAGSRFGRRDGFGLNPCQESDQPLIA
jgi:hypothetical protein